MFRSSRTFICAISLLIACVASRSAEPKKQSGEASGRGLTLVWSDEFNGSNGSAPDAQKWTAVTNDSGYGNRELEFYTPRQENVHLQNGSLVITARREEFTGPDGQSRNYTSARLESKGLFDFKYGRVEARIKIPKGQGIWPAFWMLGTNYEQVGWPACGEIDIMENVGFEPSKVHGSLHGPGYSGGQPLTGAYSLPDQARFSDGYHVFAIEWEPRMIRFYVDGTLFETQSADSVPAGRWAFDHPFYLVLNVAIGGYWPGNPDASTEFPQSMLVDWVRVYKEQGTRE